MTDINAIDWPTAFALVSTVVLVLGTLTKLLQGSTTKTTDAKKSEPPIKAKKDELDDIEDDLQDLKRRLVEVEFKVGTFNDKLGTLTDTINELRVYTKEIVTERKEDIERIDAKLENLTSLLMKWIAEGR